MAVQDTLEILSGKWKLPLIISLSFKTYRFKELVHEIGISPRMLSKELQDLETNQMVERKVHNTKPISVEYSATPYAKTLNKVIEEMRNWGLQHRQMIMRPQMEIED